MSVDLIEPAVFFAFACSAVFAAGYTVIAPWWRSAVGRAMVAMDAALMVLLLPSALHYAIGLNVANPFFRGYYVGSLVLTGMIALWRLWVIWREQRRQ
jgi:hypothetical protein